MRPCCLVDLQKYQPTPNPYNSHLFERNGWMPPNPFNQSQYVLEHYRPSAAAYCCWNTPSYVPQPTLYVRGGGCCGR